MWNRFDWDSKPNRAGGRFEIPRSMRWMRAADESSRVGVLYCIPPAKHLATCDFAYRQSLTGFAQFYTDVGLLLPQTRRTRTGPRSGGVRAGSPSPWPPTVRFEPATWCKSKLNRVSRSPLNRTNRPDGLRHSGREVCPSVAQRTGSTLARPRRRRGRCWASRAWIYP